MSPRRYEHPGPGAMTHLDVKILGRIPDRGGWRIHCRSKTVRGRGIGYDFVHTAIDDHTRLAYIEALNDEKGAVTSVRRAAASFAARGIASIERVLTDNARSMFRPAAGIRSLQQPKTELHAGHPPGSASGPAPGNSVPEPLLVLPATTDMYPPKRLPFPLPCGDVGNHALAWWGVLVARILDVAER
ncbi:hypothetical protein DMH08_15790 [Actinomadura sp. WAC 06369]|nr:hypothetical protein DMH08_15790 [Actinomadura sp. WAC 06369]